MISQVATYAFGTLSAYGLLKLVEVIYARTTSPILDLPGPKNVSWLWGNLKIIRDSENAVVHEQWVKEYGKSIVYSGFLGIRRLYTTDTRALNHILMHTETYQKSSQAQRMLARMLGAGLLVVEGQAHKQQRKIMNPAFSSGQIRGLTDIFIAKSLELRDKWANAVNNSHDGRPVRIDVLHWLSLMTLDVIGLAGFNYSFDSLSDPASVLQEKDSAQTPIEPKNELAAAFKVVLGSNKLRLFDILVAYVPLLELIPTESSRTIKHANDTMHRIGKKLLSESKEDTDSASRKDLLSLLVRANMAVDTPDSAKLSDKDVLAQIKTFLVAGHETTSTGVTWALLALSRLPHIQQKLRAELLTVSTDEPTMDELNALKYLDFVVREVMRLHAPVPNSLRIAVQDDVIPLNEGYVGRDGQLHKEIRVKAGDTVFIPILAINRDPTLWGDDAKEFIPERWEKIPENTGSIPGVWSNLMTFFGGARSCIGYHFSLLEMKALIFTLVRAFEFELAVPSEDIGVKTGIVQRPILLSDSESRSQLPLLVKAYKET